MVWAGILVCQPILSTESYREQQGAILNAVWHPETDGDFWPAKQAKQRRGRGGSQLTFHASSSTPYPDLRPLEAAVGRRGGWEGLQKARMDSTA